MHHAITLGGLLLALAALGGLGAVGFGLLMLFAGGMSDAPAEGESTARAGCILAVIGAVVLAVCLVVLL